MGDTVKIHYIGLFEDGTEFDNSYKRFDPLFFRVGEGQVIEGWERAIVHLSRGHKVRLTCPPGFAYGEYGYPPIIGPYQTLVYEIELISFGSEET